MADSRVCPGTDFKDVVIHTARCTKCNGRNKSFLKQCSTCSTQLCPKCFVALDRSSPGKHRSNIMGSGSMADLMAQTRAFGMRATTAPTSAASASPVSSAGAAQPSTPNVTLAIQQASRPQSTAAAENPIQPGSSGTQTAPRTDSEPPTIAHSAGNARTERAEQATSPTPLPKQPRHVTFAIDSDDEDLLRPATPQAFRSQLSASTENPVQYGRSAGQAALRRGDDPATTSHSAGTAQTGRAQRATSKKRSRHVAFPIKSEDEDSPASRAKSPRITSATLQAFRPQLSPVAEDPFGPGLSGTRAAPRTGNEPPTTPNSAGTRLAEQLTRVLSTTQKRSRRVAFAEETENEPDEDVIAAQPGTPTSTLPPARSTRSSKRLKTTDNDGPAATKPAPPTPAKKPVRARRAPPRASPKAPGPAPATEQEIKEDMAAFSTPATYYVLAPQTQLQGVYQWPTSCVRDEFHPDRFPRTQGSQPVVPGPSSPPARPQQTPIGSPEPAQRAVDPRPATELAGNAELQSSRAAVDPPRPVSDEVLRAIAADALYMYNRAHQLFRFLSHEARQDSRSGPGTAGIGAGPTAAREARRALQRTAEAALRLLDVNIVASERASREHDGALAAEQGEGDGARRQHLAARPEYTVVGARATAQANGEGGELGRGHEQVRGVLETGAGRQLAAIFAGVEGSDAPPGTLEEALARAAEETVRLVDSKDSEE